MDMQHEMRQPLEPIQEESEQEDGSIKSNAGEEEEDDFETLETEEVMAEDESEAEEEGNDGASSSRQPSRSLDRKSFSQTQSAFNHWREMKNITAPDSADLTGDASSSRLPGSAAQEWRSHGKWRPESFTVRKQQHKALQQKNVRRRGSRRTLPPEPFPQWVLDLMVNIEEATTHQLVVE